MHITEDQMNDAARVLLKIESVREALVNWAGVGKVERLERKLGLSEPPTPDDARTRVAKVFEDISWNVGRDMAVDGTTARGRKAADYHLAAVALAEKRAKIETFEAVRGAIHGDTDVDLWAGWNVTQLESEISKLEAEQEKKE